MSYQRRCFYSIKLIPLLAAAFGPNAGAAVYYVDSISGNDANTGLTTSAPLKTLYKATSINLYPGDSILLKRGCEWNERLLISSSGAPGQPLQIGAYGAGPLPVIRPPVSISNWVLDAPSVSIWKAPTASPPSKMLWIDDVLQQWAREPDEGFFIMDSTGPLETQFTDLGLNLPREEVVGSTVQLYNVPWIVETRWVLDYSTMTHQVTLNAKPTYNPLKPGGGYVLSGKRSYLDQKGEWAWEKGWLYLWPSDDISPVGRSVTTSRGLNGVDIRNQHDVAVQDIAVLGGDPSGVYVYQSTGVVLRGLDIQFSGTMGIYGLSARDLLIENCAIAESGSRAIATSKSNYVQILNNRIENSGLNITQTSGGAAVNSGLSDNVLIEGNTIQRSGYNGISATGDHTLVKNNIVDSSCMTLDDCGGIYTSASYEIATGAPPRVGEIQIIGNIVKGASSKIAMGIYLDDKSYNVRVEDNVVQDVSLYGIFVHNTHDSVVARNTVFYSTRAAFSIREDTIVNIEGFTRNNRVEDNIFIPSPANSTVIEHRTAFSWTDFGAYDRNIFGTIFTPLAAKLTTNSTLVSTFTLSEWIAKSGEDLHSTETGAFYEFKPFRYLSVGSELVVNGTFDTDVGSWSKWSTTGGGVLSWSDPADCGHSGGCMSVVYNSAGSDALTVSTRLPIVAGRLYEVKLDVRSKIPGKTMWLVFRSGAGTDAVRTPFIMPSSWETIVRQITVRATDPAGVFWLETYGDTTDYQVDNISIREITLKQNNLADAVRILVNRERTPQFFSLEGETYVDVRNSPVAGSVTLQPFSAMVLLPAFNNKDGACNNRETHLLAPDDCPTPTGPDVTPPAVSFTAPGVGDPLAGVVPVAVDASDDRGLDRVVFYVDGVAVSTDTAAPYGFSWDTRPLAAGPHLLAVWAHDASANSARSDLSVVLAPQDKPTAYPNPYRGDPAGMSFSGLAPGSPLAIYTLNGRPVAELASDAFGRAHWPGTDNGAPAASGVYFVSAQGPGGRKVFKIMVVR